MAMSLLSYSGDSKSNNSVLCCGCGCKPDPISAYFFSFPVVRDKMNYIPSRLKFGG